jgi:pyruvate dehydrogenase E1 component beta subunit
LIKDNISKHDDLVIFGQNIDAGSCLSGLTKGLSEVNSGITQNTQNSENTLVGCGFGLMLNGVSSIFFMKQLDFLLLGIDQIVNTYNVVRQGKPKASFTIFPVTVDSGYEGPQSSLNNLDDFCSIAGVDGFSFTNKIDTSNILNKYLVKPGFRIMSAGQRLMQQEVLDVGLVEKDSECCYFKYKTGSDATIVCFNHALPYGVEFSNKISARGRTSSMFSVNTHLYHDFSGIIEDLKCTKKLILIDDTKSRSRMSDQFIVDALSVCELKNKIIVSRFPEDISYAPCKDLLDIDYEGIIDEIFR